MKSALRINGGRWETVDPHARERLRQIDQAGVPPGVEVRKDRGEPKVGGRRRDSPKPGRPRARRPFRRTRGTFGRNSTVSAVRVTQSAAFVGSEGGAQGPPSLPPASSVCVPSAAVLGGQRVDHGRVAASRIGRCVASVRRARIASAARGQPRRPSARGGRSPAPRSQSRSALLSRISRLPSHSIAKRARPVTRGAQDDGRSGSAQDAKDARGLEGPTEVDTSSASLSLTLVPLASGRSLPSATNFLGRSGRARRRRCRQDPVADLSRHSRELRQRVVGPRPEANDAGRGDGQRKAHYLAREVGRGRGAFLRRVRALA